MITDYSLRPPAVDLVWDFSQKTKDSSTSKAVCGLVTLKERPTEVVFTNEKSTSAAIIPDSVLQYERQIRKQQHAKKASQTVTKEQMQVVYLDDHIVVVNKPAGVLTVPGIRDHFSIANLVFDNFVIKQDSDVTHCIVHRLDMDTSGLLVFGRNRQITNELHTVFRDRKVLKEYEALVMGHLPETESPFLIDLPLQRDHEHPPFMRVATPQSEKEAAEVLVALKERGYKNLTQKRPKPSQTIVRVVERGADDGLPWTRLRLEPVTGRTHQLRVHCAAMGFPIVGDPTYSIYGEACPSGGLERISTYLKGVSGEWVEVETCSLNVQKDWTARHPPNAMRMCLHARLLQLEHPVTGEWMKWEMAPDF